MKYPLLKGVVLPGDQVGTSFGVATANMSNDETWDALPHGVYLISSQIDGRRVDGLLHWGPRDTFARGLTAEAHFLAFEGDLYGKQLELMVHAFVRKNKRFTSIDALYTQIETDITTAEKFFLRLFIKNAWKQITPYTREKMAETAAERIERLDVFQKATVIYGFDPFQDEIPFLPMLAQKYLEKQFFVPTWANGQIQFDSPMPDLIFVPAIAANKKGERLGRGGGYYDRFLVTNVSPTITVLPCFAHIKIIPTEPHDQQVQTLLFIEEE